MKSCLPAIILGGALLLQGCAVYPGYGYYRPSYYGYSYGVYPYGAYSYGPRVYRPYPHGAYIYRPPAPAFRGGYGRGWGGGWRGGGWHRH